VRSVLVAAAVTMVYATLPSAWASFRPATVTVWAVLQLAVVNVRLAGDTAPSVVSLELSPIVTLAVGWLVSLTVNVAWPPASSLTSPLVGSDREARHVVVGGGDGHQLIGQEVEGVSPSWRRRSNKVTVVVWTPSATRSSTPVTVTV